MRALFLILAAGLALSACGKNDQTDNNANVDENLAAENIVSNDVTAIDAVTADAANMAADVDYSNLTDNLLDNSANLGNAGAPATPKKAPARRSPAPTPAPAAENSSANATE